MDDNTSQLSKGTNYSTRALNLLDQIRLNTSFETHREFLATLKQLKRRQIDSDTCQQRVSELLREYPDLLAQFEESMNAQPAENQHMNQFNNAVSFVYRVKVRYAHNISVYTTFLGLLKEYQLGSRNQEEVAASVAELLADSPELVKDFAQFCGSPGMKTSDSNATLSAPIQTEVITETTPLLAQGDLESQIIPRRNRFSIIVGGMIFIVIILVGLAAFFGYLDRLFKLIGGN